MICIHIFVDNISNKSELIFLHKVKLSIYAI